MFFDRIPSCSASFNDNKNQYKELSMPSKLRLAAAFFAIFIEINLMMVTIVYTTNYYKMSPGPFIFNVVGWSIVIIITGLLARSAIKSNIVFLFPFLCIMVSLAGSVFLNNTFSIITGKEVKNVSVADVPAYRDAVVIGFKDGKLESGYRGEYNDPHDSKSSTFYAVPFVPDNWDKTESVTVWVICKNSAAPCLADTHLAIVRNIYPGGVEQAEKKYGLKSDPKILTIQWITSTEDIVRAGKKVFVLGVSIINAAWLIIFIGCLVLLFRNNKGEQSARQ
jgi:hypothetical protein